MGDFCRNYLHTVCIPGQEVAVWETKQCFPLHQTLPEVQGCQIQVEWMSSLYQHRHRICIHTLCCSRRAYTVLCQTSIAWEVNIVWKLAGPSAPEEQRLRRTEGIETQIIVRHLCDICLFIIAHLLLSCHIHACFAYYIQMHNISMATVIYWLHTPDTSFGSRWGCLSSFFRVTLLRLRGTNLYCGNSMACSSRRRCTSLMKGCCSVLDICFHLTPSCLLTCVWLTQLLPAIVFLRSICIFHTVHSIINVKIIVTLSQKMLQGHCTKRCVKICS